MNGNTNHRRTHGPADYGPLFAGMRKRGIRYRPTTEPQPPKRETDEQADTEEYRPAYWWQRD